MSAVVPRDPVGSDRRAVRHALMLERVRAERYRIALANATDRKLKGSCGRRFDASLARAVQLALTLVDMGEEVPMTGAGVDFDDRLLEAMDATMRRVARR